MIIIDRNSTHAPTKCLDIDWAMALNTDLCSLCTFFYSWNRYQKVMYVTTFVSSFTNESW